MKNCIPLQLLLVTSALLIGAGRPYTGGEVLSLPVSACELYVPNAFSPNNDGVNDIFRPATQCPVAEYQLLIFNRWGRQLFQSRTIEKGWDGKVRSEDQPIDVYTYMIEYRFQEGEQDRSEILSGSIALIR